MTMRSWKSCNFPIIFPLLSYFCLSAFLTATYSSRAVSASAVVPTSNCYALDNTSRLVDFTDWIGHPFEYDGQDGDLVVRFCKDVEKRSQAGYIDFGHYTTSRYFVSGPEPLDFTQKFHSGDLMNCEHTFDKMGRTAQVNIVCGKCISGSCKGDLGCICSVSYDKSMCSVTIELAIPCTNHGPRVFKGFTVGFNPRSWEIVYNGMTQLGFEKAYNEFSFGTDQTDLSLYITAISSFSGLVGKPVFQIYPQSGLEVKLSGSAANGAAPSTLSPSVLNVNWRCEIAQEDPYEVHIQIPIEGYNPIEFTLTKICEYKQGREGDSMRGWATFGILSCVMVVLSFVFCCGGFIYKTRVQNQYGIYALPGMTILSACLEAVSSRPVGGYNSGSDSSGNFPNQASWDSSQINQRNNERRYGSI
ncbi:G-protein coupled receptor [Carex rostrata]